MIAPPLNDTVFLTKMSLLASDYVDSDVVRNLANQTGSTQALIEYLRNQPQRNDYGSIADGPRASDEDGNTQRVRMAPTDPNCVERAALYLSVAERLDPQPVRQLVTMQTPVGLHTFPVEDGMPVQIDPQISRNALHGALYQEHRQRNGITPIEEYDPKQLLGWVLDIAHEPATQQRNGLVRLRNAEQAFDVALAKGIMNRNAIPDVGFVMALAATAARELFGEPVAQAVALASQALAGLRQRNLNLNFATGAGRWVDDSILTVRANGKKAKIDWGRVGKVGNVAGKSGARIAGAYVRYKLAMAGVPPGALDMVEKDLNDEGLTLGAFGEPLPFSLHPALGAGRVMPSLASIPKNETTQPRTAEPTQSTQPYWHPGSLAALT